MTVEERYLQQAIDRYAPEIAAVAHAALLHLRKQFPAAQLLVYDRRTSLPIGFAPSDGKSAVFSVVLYSRWVRFFFLEGVLLEDPQGRLEGKGKQVRSIRLDADAAILRDPYIAGLIERMVRETRSDFHTGKGHVVLKSTLAVDD
jgi:hypothetical protein